jgi:hypothetical protein
VIRRKCAREGDEREAFLAACRWFLPRQELLERERRACRCAGRPHSTGIPSYRVPSGTGTVRLHELGGDCSTNVAVSVHQRIALLTSPHNLFVHMKLFTKKKRCGTQSIGPIAHLNSPHSAYDIFVHIKLTSFFKKITHSFDPTLLYIKNKVKNFSNEVAVKRQNF